MGLFDFLKKGKEEPAKRPAATPRSTQMPGQQPNATSGSQQNVSGTSTSAHQDVYTVQSGDSLSKIAKKHYGNANAWTKIYNANKSTIGENPDLIRPGQRLNIPRD
ncbi:LysM peptidoglycan-binding domain-containing protein [Pontibacter sp. KCTC 32443]|uniref:LysM peptidoglycan-binding domain-containing protein n=1 Tax=Pontibacter TaxID=323449 RepID=UPI00164DFC0E|nr:MULTISPECIES: LysM peptidoglycan-binding domain-containing protein [Pontibacter]MBC5774191.1 LysM peptidoglycan-binding domain-containing protein [Pontibacter sp. KCTC 32443]